MKSLSKITGKHIGKSYAEMPCMTLMHQIYTEMGFDAPESFKGLNLENYQAHFKADSKLTQARMLQLIKTIGRHVAVDRLKIFDLVVILQPGKIMFPAMYVGKKMIMASSIKGGVEVVRIGDFNRPIMARRLF